MDPITRSVPKLKPNEYRSLPNGNDPKFKFKIFNMGVDFIQNFISDPKIDFNFIFEVNRINAEYNGFV